MFQSCYVYARWFSSQRAQGLDLVLTLDSAILKQVCSTKYVSMYLDQHLTWQAHVDYVLN